MDNDFQLDEELQAVVDKKFPHIIDLDAIRAQQEEQEGDDEEVEEQPSEPPEEVPAPETGDEDEETPEQPEPGETEPEPTGAPTAGSSLIEVAPGVVLPRDQALAYIEFDAILRDDPELQQLVDERIRGRSSGGEGSPGTQLPSPPTTFTLPEVSEEDLEDPTIAALYNTAKQQAEYLKAVDERLAALSDVTFTREAEEIASLIGTTKESFSAAHNLTPDEMEQVATVAERLNLVPSLLSGVDPVTGAAAPRDRTSALNRAFDIAYWYLPQFREREVATQVANRAKSNRRKQRLAGVSGTSGSVPKNPPPLNTEQNRREAMIRDVAEMLGQTREE